MAKLIRKNISKRTVDALKAEKDTVFWDSELTGLRGEGVPHRQEGLCRPDPHAGPKGEAGEGGQLRRDPPVGGSAPGGPIIWRIKVRPRAASPEAWRVAGD